MRQVRKAGRGMEVKLTRRQVAWGALTVAGSGAAVLGLVAHDKTDHRNALPLPGDPNNPTFAQFEALCRIVLARSQLDGALARRMFAIFVVEPWGPMHIGHAYAKLRAALANSGARLRDRPAVELSESQPGRAMVCVPSDNDLVPRHLLSRAATDAAHHPKRRSDVRCLARGRAAALSGKCRIRRVGRSAARNYGR